jgi:hypothetical protein
VLAVRLTGNVTVDQPAGGRVLRQLPAEEQQPSASQPRENGPTGAASFSVAIASRVRVSESFRYDSAASSATRSGAEILASVPTNS